MVPNLSSSVATAKNNLTSFFAAFLIANNNLTGAANEFVDLVETIEKKLNVLQEKENNFGSREEELNVRYKVLEEREAKCARREHQVSQREKEVDTKMMKWEETERQMEKNTSLLPSLIKINVRGQRFTIPKDALLKYPGSYFESMIQSNHQQQLNGEFFINRNDSLFVYVFDYLLSNKLRIPKETEDLKSLKQEFEFYNIPFPSIPILPPSPAATANLACNHEAVIKKWLPNCNLKLVYKASTDGFASKDFHRLCDNKGPTITIIQSSEGYLFGGYSPLSWDSSYKTKTHPDFFIFTLSNPHAIPPTKYPLKHADAYAIFCHPLYGPTFGGGNDIRILSDSNQTSSNYTNFPSSYEDITGKGNNTFNGTKRFTAKDIEVYFVI